MQQMSKTNEDKTVYWEKIIEEARKYPEGVAAYCSQNDLSKDKYYFWFQRLRTSHPEWTNLSGAPVRSRKRLRQMQSETEVVERPRRRKFNAKEKKRILKEADASPKGQVAALLRREGVYASQLLKWRAERDRSALKAKNRGQKGSPLTVRIRQLQNRCERLERQLRQANAIIDLQKKISEVMETALTSESLQLQQS
jgi:transposase